jgi:RNA polymerase sigma-70 factor (sigma-E family)
MLKSTQDEEFSLFVQSHRTELLRAARLLSANDPHRAEDLVQTALTRVYATWHRLRGAPAPYAHRILLNVYIDQTRTPRWRMERSVPDLPEPSASTATSLSTDGTLLPDGDGEEVRAALAELPPKMRAVIVLRHWLDLSVQESADLLGCSPGTIKSQTAKAMAHLRARLGTSETSHPALPARSTL